MSNIITISPDKALRREFIERAILKKMNPSLIFMDLFPVVDLEGATTFKYFEDPISAEDDIVSGKMTEPMEMDELSKLTKLEVSPIEKKIGDVYQFGYAIDISKKVQRENGFIDELLRAYKRAAYGMARKINLDVFNTMDSFASATPITLNDGTWDQSNSIRDDLIDMKRSFEDIVGWDYSLTDLFVASPNYREVEKYYKAIDEFNPSSVEGIAFTNCKTLVPEGTVYGIDKNIQPLTIYKNVDSDFSTLEGGLVNVNIVEDDSYPFSKHIELWCEMGIASKVPEAILKQTGV